MTITAHIPGDKFPRTITAIETGPDHRSQLLKVGYDGQCYIARRPRKAGKGEDMVSLVYRVAKTGEFVHAI